VCCACCNPASTPATLWFGNSSSSRRGGVGPGTARGSRWCTVAHTIPQCGRRQGTGLVLAGMCPGTGHWRDSQHRGPGSARHRRRCCAHGRAQQFTRSTPLALLRRVGLPIALCRCQGVCIRVAWHVECCMPRPGPRWSGQHVPCFACVSCCWPHGMTACSLQQHTKNLLSRCCIWPWGLLTRLSLLHLGGTTLFLPGPARPHVKAGALSGASRWWLYSCARTVVGAVRTRPATACWSPKYEHAGARWSLLRVAATPRGAAPGFAAGSTGLVGGLVQLVAAPCSTTT
jgi:hypothetical protein